MSLSIESLNNIQLAFFLTGGYLVSRLMIKSQLPESLVFWMIGRKHLSVSKLILYLLAINAILGIFIHHAIVVLTLIPLAHLMQEVLSKENPQYDRFVPTMLAACLMYGANIGGIGAITSSAANGILIAGANGILPGLGGAVPGAEKLTFFLWMLWGVPLVLVYTLLAWAVIVLFFQPFKHFKEYIKFEPTEPIENVFRRPAVVFAVLTFGAAFLFSMASNVWASQILPLTIATAIFFLTIIALLFFLKIPKDGHKVPLLTLSDCVSNLPKRGLALVAITMVIAFLLGLGIHYFRDALTGTIALVVDDQTSILTLMLIVAIFGTFTTELLSNTVIQYALFALMPSLATLVDFPILVGMIVATLASSSAFMSPLSTGVNSLAFGEMRGASLRMLLFSGFCMNLVGSLLVAGWTLTVTRWVLGI
ncbi:MAG: hypothetical protein JNN12_11705 [Bacteroidetes Order II. Incertae sedis bacterium]|nr:hypothetical protein [Bacteroidetes Order II. bacterium]